LSSRRHWVWVVAWNQEIFGKDMKDILGISLRFSRSKFNSPPMSPKSKYPDEERIQGYSPASERNLAVTINPVFYSVAEVDLPPY